MKGQDEGGRKGSRRRSGWPFSTIRSDSPKAAPPTVIGANPQSCSGDPLALDQVDLPRTRVIQISARFHWGLVPSPEGRLTVTKKAAH